MAVLKFNNAMKEAVLSGRKTQTRRLAKEFNYIEELSEKGFFRIGANSPYAVRDDDTGEIIPKGTYEELIIKEKFLFHYCRFGQIGFYISLCDENGSEFAKAFIKSIKINKLHNITSAECEAEGIIQLPASGRYVISQGDQYFGNCSYDAKEVFSWLWDSIYGNWTENPYVWVINFVLIKDSTMSDLI